jgi:predicted NAD-dependent protein-ADP-ribosyltransferase YbiA (DUF1768 family)
MKCDKVYKIKDSEMDRACNMLGREKKYVQHFGWNTVREGLF